jgi:endonuclease/exonuclease/phosphatase family metal-dependent hydrolase
MENFFDHTYEGGGEADKEFSSGGRRHWTAKRFFAKCDAVAKSFMWMGDRYDRMPDVIGLAEVENKEVLVKLLKYTILRKYDYKIIHYDSGDRRGIDVALLYRESVMSPVCITLKTPHYGGKKLSTRDILHSRMRLPDGRNIDFIVNHHPSKFGGESVSEGRRKAAMTALKELCDSIGNVNIVAMGDFNDSPEGAAFQLIDNCLVNEGMDLHRKGEGTIRYEGRWELIDMFLTGPGVESEMEICRMPFHLVREKKHPGLKPFRTYSGPRYIGGISDHLPIVLKIY